MCERENERGGGGATAGDVLDSGLALPVRGVPPLRHSPHLNQALGIQVECLGCSIPGEGYGMRGEGSMSLKYEPASEPGVWYVVVWCGMVWSCTLTVQSVETSDGVFRRQGGGGGWFRV